jgi:serine/threonine protein kinase
MKPVALQVRLPAIGGYQVIEQIARCGMGAVYKGRNPLSGQLVAIKLLPPEATENEVVRLRFAQECQVARKLIHPDIVHVLDFGVDGLRPFLVMEYVEGETLGQRLEREGRLPEGEAVRLIRRVGLALHWAHQQKVIHRDVKPDNILLSRDGRAKLADFGLVKDLDGDFDLTKSLSGLGTPNFMAPEQFQDAKRADARSDLYSLAATLYQAVTGVLPFRGLSARALVTMLRKKLADDIARPRQVVPELSERLDREVTRAMRADHRERHPSVLAFLDSLADEKAPAAEEAAAPPGGKEHRVKARYSAPGHTSCQPVQRASDGHVWDGRLANISETGLCVELNRRFEPGAFLAVTLQGLRAWPFFLLARVVWVKRDASDRWKLGCRFDQPLTEPELKELL